MPGPPLRGTLLGVLEKAVEEAFVREARRRGALALKMVPLGRAGFPDRTCLASPGRVAFAELKRPGEKPRRLQRWWIRKLRGMGFLVAEIDRPETIGTFFDEWLGAG